MNYLIKGGAALLALSLVFGGVTLYRLAMGSGLPELSGSIERRTGYGSQIGKSDLDLGRQPIQRIGDKLIFSAREGATPWPLQLPLDWSVDPFGDTNWRFQLHAWRMIDPLLNEYFATGNKEHLREAFDYVQDWFRYHYEQRRETTMAWHDMASGIRAMKLALLLDRYHAGHLGLAPDDARQLMTLVDEHARRLQDKDFIAQNNHGVFQVFGLNLLCTVAADRGPCAYGLEFASKMFSVILSSQFTDDGVHRENSPDYHEFVRQTIRKLGGSKRFNDTRIAELLAKATSVEPWLIDPAGNFVAVGDTSGRGRPLALKADSPPVIGDFSRSGYAVVRDKNSMLFVMGMAHTLTHKHADDLSFVLFEHGRSLFIDTGKYGYNKDSKRRYVESAAAHNTISLFEQEIRPRNISLTGSELAPVLSDEHHFRISGQVERPGLFKQRREIRYAPGQLIVIRDEVSSEQEQQFVSSLHLARDLIPELVDGGFDVVFPAGIRIKARLREADCRVETVRGQVTPYLGWESVGYLQMEPASVVRAICPGQSRTITWTVTLQ